MTTFDSYSLDMDEINAQIEEESLMPAQLIGSEYKTLTFQDRETGQTIIKDVWELRWDRLDMELMTRDGNKYLYYTTHSMPNPNKDTPVQNRKNMTYVKQVECFGKLGLKGRHPNDYVGAKHWIRETTTGNGQFSKNWWKSEAVYVDGQSYEEATGKVPSSVIEDNMNPPVEVSANGSDQTSVYSLFVDTINGLSHREALTAVRNEPKLESNLEIMEGLNSGQLFDDLIEQGFIKDEDGKYIKVESE
jgi:hypothetical protein